MNGEEHNLEDFWFQQDFARDVSGSNGFFTRGKSMPPRDFYFGVSQDPGFEISPN